jgi:hypothetical protein
VPGAQAILPPLPGTPPGQGWWTGGGIDGNPEPSRTAADDDDVT